MDEKSYPFKRLLTTNVFLKRAYCSGKIEKDILDRNK